MRLTRSLSAESSQVPGSSPGVATGSNTPADNAAWAASSRRACQVLMTSTVLAVREESRGRQRSALSAATRPTRPGGHRTWAPPTLACSAESRQRSAAGRHPFRCGCRARRLAQVHRRACCRADLGNAQRPSSAERNRVTRLPRRHGRVKHGRVGGRPVLVLELEGECHPRPLSFVGWGPNGTLSVIAGEPVGPSPATRPSGPPPNRGPTSLACQSPRFSANSSRGKSHT
jgi:hypothetical protein